MAELTERRTTTVRTGGVAGVQDRYDQAYQLLHVAFVIAPTIAGLDKFFHLLANWDKYMAPQLARMLPFSPHVFMLIVGAVEIAAGLVVAFRPRIGAYIVAVWLALIVVNLVLHGGYLDIALRDVGLFLAALALGKLSEAREATGQRAFST